MTESETAATYDPHKPLWSIMTKSRGGTVSVIRDLTEAQARKTYERLDPWYGQSSETLTVHTDFLAVGTFGRTYSFGGGHYCEDGDIEIREVFGPPGWSRFEDLDLWPKFYEIYTDNDLNVLPDEYQEHPHLAAQHRNRASCGPATSQGAQPNIARSEDGSLVMITGSVP